MAVAANDNHVFLLRNERAQLVAFVGENFVGMIVAFVVAVGSDDWGGADEHAKGDVRGSHGFFEPRHLFRTPDCFGRTVGVGVGTDVTVWNGVAVGTNVGTRVFVGSRACVGVTPLTTTTGVGVG